MHEATTSIENPQRHFAASTSISLFTLYAHTFLTDTQIQHLPITKKKTFAIAKRLLTIKLPSYKDTKDRFSYPNVKLIEIIL